MSNPDAREIWDEIMDAWPLTEIDALSKACWCGLFDQARGVGQANDLPSHEVCALLDAVMYYRENDNGSTQTGEELENSISWRPSDNWVMDALREGCAFAAKMYLLLYQRCSFQEAERLVPYLRSKVRGEPLTIQEISIEQACQMAESSKVYVIRHRERVFVSAPYRLENKWIVHLPDGGQLKLEHADQVWQMVPTK